MKIIGIVKNDCITGIQYGEIEVPDTQDMTPRTAERAARAAYNARLARIRKNNMKKK